MPYKKPIDWVHWHYKIYFNNCRRTMMQPPPSFPPHIPQIDYFKRVIFGTWDQQLLGEHVGLGKECCFPLPKEEEVGILTPELNINSSHCKSALSPPIYNISLFIQSIVCSNYCRIFAYGTLKNKCCDPHYSSSLKEAWNLSLYFYRRFCFSTPWSQIFTKYLLSISDSFLLGTAGKNQLHV